MSKQTIDITIKTVIFLATDKKDKDFNKEYNRLPGFQKYFKDSDEITSTLFCNTGNFNIVFWKNGKILHQIPFKLNKLLTDLNPEVTDDEHY